MTNRKENERPPFKAPEIIPDNIEVPDNTILLVPDHPAFTDPPHFVKAGKQREWFTPYFYNCLPLVFGNQHGFLMLATYDFIVRWDGDDHISGVSIHILENVPEPNFIVLESHFGSGILTVQSRFVFRTPKGVNMMVKEPPNYPMHGLCHMNAVVETDNLRRDFTFNIKITQPQLDIYIPKGTPLGCLVPYPRYFLDLYEMEELRNPKLLDEAQRTIQHFARERAEFDKGDPRRRYMEGHDIYDIEFEEHQKSLDMGDWWHTRNEHKEAESQSEDNEADNKQPWWKKIIP